MDENAGTPSNLSKRLEVAIRAAHAAGKILCEGFRSGYIAYETKSNSNDPVTQFDLRADRTIVDIVRASFPHDPVLTEERGDDGASASGRWVIDPLDGTNNFSRHIPHFAVSIAYCDHDRPLVACIHDPIRDETYTAVRGEGAHLNDVSIRVSTHESLEGAILGMGMSNRPTVRASAYRQMPAFIGATRALRMSGSASLDLAYVAAGRFDGIWYPSLHWWDVAAGILLIEEAGGRTSDFQGQQFSGDTSSMAGSNGHIHDDILSRLREETDGMQ
ncbi:inositol monophosphatase family protein [Candidatus Bipolaricaulota bacterium]